MAVEDIYLVTDRINPVDSREVDELERAIGSLPLGDRELMARCGQDGEFCDLYMVWDPRLILKHNANEREKWTFERCVESSGCDPGPLTRKDFAELWLFATGGDSDKLVYFPRHPGILFKLWGDLDTIGQFPRGFSDMADLCGDKLSPSDATIHPFPYFEPKGNHRSSSSFFYQPRTQRVGIPTDLNTDQLTAMIADYWNKDKPQCVRMPEEGYGDHVYVFVKRIGALIYVSRDATNYPGVAHGGMHFDKEFLAEAKAFERELTRRIKEPAK